MQKERGFRSIVPLKSLPFAHEKTTIREPLGPYSGLDPFIPNRDQLDARQLKNALENLQLKRRQEFHYTDVNFLLLGSGWRRVSPASRSFIWRADLYTLEDDRAGWTGRKGSITVRESLASGNVHDPKRKVLGCHAEVLDFFNCCWSERYDVIWRMICAWLVSKILAWESEYNSRMESRSDRFGSLGYTGPSSCTIERGRKL